MSENKIIAYKSEDTVVSMFERSNSNRTSFQTEKQLEDSFIKQLVSQGYEKIFLKNQSKFEKNLRKQLEDMNNFKFTDLEWNKIHDEFISNKKDGYIEKTIKIQNAPTYLLELENGKTKNIRLIDKKNIFKNKVQVMNQFEIEGKYKNVYDVTILINGLPLVHIELKRRGVSIKEAFNQINRYKAISFSAGAAYYQFVQLFVISNGTHTKYYSNTTRQDHINNSSSVQNGSFEFTSYWADSMNNQILDLEDFTSTFFLKNSLLKILAKYCVLNVKNELMVMRPYQITATEKILNKVISSLNEKSRIGTTDAGGYIWHTTGSGKTLTSFKTAKLVSELENIEKVLFIVDRKDLDYQTMQEYDKFEKGAVDSTKNTSELEKKLINQNSKIVVTTIQKLSKLIANNSKKLDIYSKNIVMIFDEAHRSQFGQMNKQIKKKFKNYLMFGFTGTPIFNDNSTSKNSKLLVETTEQVFGEQLHAYTIVNGIADQNVLPFMVDYINTFEVVDNLRDEEISGIQKEKILLNPMRISEITDYIISFFNKKTKRNKNISLIEKRRTGFNSIFAVSSIEAAKKYYLEFKSKQSTIPINERLRVATIFSYSPNSDENYVSYEDENNEDVNELDKDSRAFLEGAISDYNELFGTSYDTSSDKFQNYYKDISLKTKNKEIDILIVVNMFLTGFDSKTLNTLWVDKDLNYHGLIQAFSRTNRIFDSIKKYGNIICFRNLNDNVDKSLTMFGDKNAKNIAIIKTLKEYLEGNSEFEGYNSLTKKLLSEFPISERIISEKKQKEFIILYNKILKLRNILTSFDKFQSFEVLTDAQLQDYQSIYLQIYDKFRQISDSDKEDVSYDIEFEIELIKTSDINIDYILELISQQDEFSNSEKTKNQIDKLIDSSPTLKSKKDLILNFYNEININKDESINKQWIDYVQNKRSIELNNVITELSLNPKLTIEFMEKSFEIGEIKTYGQEIIKLLPNTSLFKKTGEKTIKEKIEEAFVKLLVIFERYNNF